MYFINMLSRIKLILIQYFIIKYNIKYSEIDKLENIMDDRRYVT